MPDAAALAAALALLPPEARAAAEAAMAAPPHRVRLARRNAAIRAAAAFAARPSARATAHALHAELKRYSTRFLRGEEPTNPLAVQLHAILALNGGSVPSWQNLRVILFGS